MGITETLNAHEEELMNQQNGKKKKNKRPKKKRERKPKKSLKQPEVIQVDVSNNSIEDFKFTVDKNWESKEFLSTVALMDVKAMLYGLPNQPIALANGYSGYIQIMEIHGYDVYSLSEQERTSIIAGYTQWLSGTILDMLLQTTNLPTDTRKQIKDLAERNDEVRYELLNPNLDNGKRFRLDQRSRILGENIVKQELVAANQYNTEFFVWVYGDSLEELNHNVNMVRTASYSFIPQFITYEKKEQILTQYYNYNDIVS